MRAIRRLLLISVIGIGLLGASPAQASPKVLKSTIAVPGWDTGTWFGAGYGNWLLAVDDTSAVRQSCPKPGQFDGFIWRFFDLKGGYTKFKASGPKTMFTHTVPETAATNPLTFDDYDIDLYLFDAKCKRIDVKGSNSGGATEKQSTRKPAHYAVIVYWYGHQANMPVTLEVS